MTFKLRLVTPDGVKYETEAIKAILPSKEGQITILPNHMPLISLLNAGEINLQINGKEHVLVTEGGMVKVANNMVEIIADTAEDIDTLDHLKIEEAKKRAEKLMSEAGSDAEFAHAAGLLEKQIAKLHVLNRRKKYRS